jgi:bifunctional DNA-binding transcriptional regulator/antitoxin component of YhaV-PrlF toxin-antitoxin module
MSVRLRRSVLCSTGENNIQAMTVTVNEETREIFPSRVRRLAGIKVGTKLEVRVSKGVVTMVALPHGDGEYAPGQRKAIDAQLAASFEDVARGRVHTFDTPEEMVAFLRRGAKKPRKGVTKAR